MRVLVTAIVLLTLIGTAYAELQTVSVGGRIEIRNRWYHGECCANPAAAAWLGPGNPPPGVEVRIPGNFMPGRVTGDRQRNLVDNVTKLLNPTNRVWSFWRYNTRGADWAVCETATSINFKADFTDNVTSFIEFYDFARWGEPTEFRSNWITGADARGNTADDIEVLQSYIETRETFGLPVQVRIGRQTMKFGKGFIVADKTTPTERYAFDGIRITATPAEKWTVDAWWMKIAENSPVESDGDVDFYGVYGTYSGMDFLSLSAYWMLVRDGRSIQDTIRRTVGWFTNDVLEDFWGVDDYDVTNLHVVGLRGQGKYEAWDYALEVAYQFGEAGQTGSLFTEQIGAPRAIFGWGPLGANVYGDNNAEYDNWALDAEVGYTFDVKWSPRPYVALAYFGGEDNRDLSFMEWLSPFNRPKSSVSWNRMFSDYNYCPEINDNGDMTNFRQVNVGVTMTPTEKLWVMVRATNTWVNEPFDWPANIEMGKWRVPIAPNLSFWTEESDDYLGLATEIITKYKYSDDLMFVLFYGHLFTGDGLKDGNYTNFNGLTFNGGSDDDDVDYVFLWSIITF